MTRSEVMLQAALLYAENGLSVIPLSGKQPPLTTNGKPLSWSPYQVKRAPLSYIHEWHRRGYLQNVGIVCGAVSNNLAVIDLDGDEAVKRFRSKFPELLTTFTVETGSGHGQHLYYYCDALPPTTRTKGFELRVNGCYVVAPPSVHPDTGDIYRLTPDDWPIMRVTDLERVRHWVTSMLKPVPRPVTNGQPRQQAVGSYYARSALHYELRDLYRAQPGSRNNQLNVAAYNLGQLVGDNLISRHVIETELLAAAMAIGLEETPALRTIRSGIEAGIREPRSKQWRRR